MGKVKCNHCGIVLPDGIAGTPCISCPFGTFVEVSENGYNRF